MVILHMRKVLDAGHTQRLVMRRDTIQMQLAFIATQKMKAMQMVFALILKGILRQAKMVLTHMLKD